MPGVERVYGDIDLVLRRGDARAAQKLIPELGYVANERFNALHGEQRLMFVDEVNERRIDVFVGSFAMCHKLDLQSQLPENGETLTLADLLLTKLQIVEINEKDLSDVTMLLRDHEVAAADDSEVVDLRRIRKVCASDWGWFTTVDQPPEAGDRGRALARGWVGGRRSRAGRGDPPGHCGGEEVDALEGPQQDRAQGRLVELPEET